MGVRPAPGYQPADELLARGAVQPGGDAGPAVRAPGAVRAAWASGGAAAVRVRGDLVPHPDRPVGAVHTGVAGVGCVDRGGAVAGAAHVVAVGVGRGPELPARAGVPVPEGSGVVLPQLPDP